MSIELSGNCHITAGLLRDNKPIGLLCGDAETGLWLWTGEDFQRIAEAIEEAVETVNAALLSACGALEALNYER